MHLYEIDVRTQANLELDMVDGFLSLSFLSTST